MTHRYPFDTHTRPNSGMRTNDRSEFSFAFVRAATPRPHSTSRHLSYSVITFNSTRFLPKAQEFSPYFTDLTAEKPRHVVTAFVKFDEIQFTF